MKTIFERTMMWILVIACQCCAWAQLATATRNVVLHRDPSSASKALEHLVAGARLTLVDATPDSGFYHVKTEDDQVGWVSSRNVSVDLRGLRIIDRKSTRL